jgi:hypothetical protein
VFLEIDNNKNNYKQKRWKDQQSSNTRYSMQCTDDMAYNREDNKRGKTRNGCGSDMKTKTCYIQFGACRFKGGKRDQQEQYNMKINYKKGFNV